LTRSVELGTSTDLVKGYYQTLSAGVEGHVEQLETLTVASQTAQEAQLETGEVLKGLTKLMAGYKGEVKDAADAADLLYTIERKGQTAVQDLIPHIGSLSKMSKDMGLSAEEMGGALAQVTQFAGDTAEAATQYRAVLVGLSKPSADLKQLWKDLEVAGSQAAIETFGFAGTLQILKARAGDSKEEMNKLMGNVRASMGIAALADDSFKGLTSRIDAMGDRVGAQGEAWDRYKVTLKAMWETFKNTVGNQAILIGEKLAPRIKELITLAGDWLESFRETGKIEEWFDRIVPGTIELVAGLQTIVKTIQDVGKMAIWLADKTPLGWLWDAGKVVKYAIDFVGTGSTEKPLGDKLFEMQGKMLSFDDTVQAMKDETIDITFEHGKIVDSIETVGLAFGKTKDKGTAAFQAIQKAAALAKTNIEAKVPVLDIDNQPALTALKQVADAAEATGKVVEAAGNKTYEAVGRTIPTLEQFLIMAEENLKRARAAEKAGLGLNLVHSQMMRNQQEFKAVLENEIAQVAFLTRQEENRFDAYEKAKKIRQESGLPDVSIGDAFGSFDTGTGPQGLPQTGKYIGHKGEIVYDREDSDRIRGGGTPSSAGVSGGSAGGTGSGVAVAEAHLHVMFLNGDRSSMREAANQLQIEWERNMKRGS